jgi:hypothetical protein
MKKHDILILVGFTIWMIGSWHGGWSAEPQSNFEGYTDRIGAILMVWGVLGEVLKGIQIHKITKISTDKLTINKAEITKDHE